MYVVILYGIEIARTDELIKAERIYRDCCESPGIAHAEVYEKTKRGVRRVY